MPMLQLVDAFIRDLKVAGRAGEMSYSVMMPAVEGLRGKGSIRKYFGSYVDVTADALRVDVGGNVKKTGAVAAVERGAPIRDVARQLARDHFSYLLNK